MSEGIVYYNDGTKCLARLAVSVHSLLRNYNGSITIIAEPDGFDLCKNIADGFGINIKSVNMQTPGPHKPFCNKTRLNTVTPYDNTIFLDTDTLVLRPIDELFRVINKYHFFTTRFSTWKTGGRKIKKRVEQWRGRLSDEMIDNAYNQEFGLNTGVFGFSKKSELMKDWYKYTIKGRDFFIPDEICCQIIIPNYRHKVVDNIYNQSCAHDKDISKAKIMHYHGRKHCRIVKGVYKYNSKMWYNELDKIMCCEFVKDVINYDRMLRRFINVHRQK